MLPSVGERVGPYEIREPIGAGGMGTVYLATDTRLRRAVAIKILNQQFYDRFEREARVIASLNHVNICTIHDVGPSYIVMELIEGTTLAERISKGAIPLREALDIAQQIANALEAAHEKGIVHRDLKPGNIKIKPDGTVKVLDFGLAKVAASPIGMSDDSPTITMSTAAPGVILGTAAYMSPEQARGLPVDKRADIWSFGVVLYEMLTGRRLFHGETVSDVLAGVLRQEPSWELVPAKARPVLRRCLERDLKRRLRDIGDAFSLLEEPPASAAASQRIKQQTLWVGGAILTLAAGFTMHAGLFTPSYMDLAAQKYVPVVLSGSDGVISRDAASAWAPDGKSFIYVAEDRTGQRQLFLRSLDSATSAQLTRETWGARYGVFSADGQRVFYLAQKDAPRELWSISAAGGTPERLLPGLGGSDFLDGIILSPDGNTLVFAKVEDGGKLPMSIWSSSPPGATPRKYPDAPAAKTRAYTRARLRFSPDGSRLAAMLYEKDPLELWLLPWPPRADGNKVRRILPQIGTWDWHASFDWMPDGKHLILTGDGDPANAASRIWIANVDDGGMYPFSSADAQYWMPEVNPRDGRVLIGRLEGAEDAMEIPLDGSLPHELIATSRHEIYPAWSPITEQFLYVTDRRGDEEIWYASRNEGWHRPLVTQSNLPPGGKYRFIAPVWSPDGSRIAYSTDGAVRQIWISSISGGSAIPALPKGYLGALPTWSPDGNWIAFGQPENNKLFLSKQQVGSTMPPIHVTEQALPGSIRPIWSPDGKWITAQVAEGCGIVSPDGKETRILFRGDPGVGSAAGWSRDSTTVYLAYLKGQDLILSGFDVKTRAERRISNLGKKRFSYRIVYSVVLSEAPDKRSVAGSFLETNSDLWLIDGVRVPPNLWHRLFRFGQ